MSTFYYTEEEAKQVFVILRQLKVHNKRIHSFVELNYLEPIYDSLSDLFKATYGEGILDTLKYGTAFTATYKGTWNSISTPIALCPDNEE